MALNRLTQVSVLNGTPMRCSSFAAAIHLVEGGRAALGDPVAVVDVARAVDAQADEEAVLLQEAGPFLVEQRAVGLQIVFDPLPGFRMFALRAPRPCGRNRARAASARRPARKTRPRPRSRPRCTARTKRSSISSSIFPPPGPLGQRLFAEVEAVRAVEIAGRAGGLDHHVEPPRGTRAEHLRRVVLVELEVLVDRRCRHGTSPDRGWADNGNGRSPALRARPTLARTAPNRLCPRSMPYGLAASQRSSVETG